MLRATWLACAQPIQYASAWTDGTHARLLEGASEAAVEKPWEARNATAGEIWAFLSRHREYLAKHHEDLLRELARASATTAVLEGITSVMRRAEELRALTIVGPAGRGTWRLKYDDRGWFDARTYAGHGSLEDAIVTALWEIRPGLITFYPGGDRSDPTQVTWKGLDINT